MTDITQRGVFTRDDNGVPVTQNGLLTSKSITFTGSNATVAVPLFHITGSVLVNALYGIVTTALANHTKVYFRLNDQTAQTAITLATGSTATNIPSGSAIEVDALATVACHIDTAAAGIFDENTIAAGLNHFQQFHVGQKTGDVRTDIEYDYTTTDTPTTGAVIFYCGWVPLSQDGRVTPV